MDAAPEDIANNMQIECPACAARYDVPDEVVLPGRAMRCARCGETWAPRAAEPEPEPAFESEVAAGFAPEAAPGSLDMRPSAELADEGWPEEADVTGVADGGARSSPLAAAPAGGVGAALVVAWLASAAVLLAAGWAAWHFHARIEHAWRPSERLFRLFGR